MIDFESSPDEWGYREAEAFKALPLIEQNAIKIAELEKEWSVLGSVREITFTVSLVEEGEAYSLANAAREQGFDATIANMEEECETELEYPYELKAKRMMEPTAESVTRWDEWFRDQTSSVPDFVNREGFDQCGADYAGWSYPKRVAPAFFLKGDARSRDHQNELGARDRTHVLFGKTLCKFEASNGWATKKNTPRSSPTFDLAPSEFLQNARRRRPSNPEPTASMFSQWLYSLYASAFGDDQDRAMGKEAEEYILAERQKAFAATDRDTMHRAFPDWRLMHNGLSLNQHDRPNHFSINDLLVGGEPLRVLPDLIYENTRTDEIIIVEIKHSQMDIPSNLWPNIWGQLWCYAQIQELRRFQKVTVIGEVWGDYYRKESLGKRRGLRDCQYVYLRASVRRNPRAVPYDRFFRTLFDIYRGAD